MRAAELDQGDQIVRAGDIDFIRLQHGLQQLFATLLGQEADDVVIRVDQHGDFAQGTMSIGLGFSQPFKHERVHR